MVDRYAEIRGEPREPPLLAYAEWRPDGTVFLRARLDEYSDWSEIDIPQKFVGFFADFLTISNNNNKTES